MDTSSLRNFATAARISLIKGVSQRLKEMGFDDNGNVVKECVSYEGGAIFDDEVVSLDFYDKWNLLRHAVETKSVREVIEETSYTWFNRLIAIRILEKNNLISPVLDYESDGGHVPLLVINARRGRIPKMSEEQREKVEELLRDDSKPEEQFQELIVAFCHENPIIEKCFGRIADYTELLLPKNILFSGFIEMLNNTDFILEDDYSSPELLGWLYQFYISDRKDEVFAKKGKVEAEEIPAATQIFTPNWIVKYMVQNTVGRIYLDNNPEEKAENFGWKYMVEPSEPKHKDTIYQYENLEDLKFSDLSCGSGHILNEFFDILYDLYIHEYYNSKQAVENILTKNIVGVDIDTRAKQLATFALLLKACQKDHSFADAHCMPRVYDMVEPYEDKTNLRNNIIEFLIGNDDKVREEIVEAIELMDNAKTLGSIMKFEISERTRNIISVRIEEYSQLEDVSEPIQKLMPYMRLILVLTESYSALVMNPPYMGGGKMNKVLSDYAKNNYPLSKSDFFAMFIERTMQLVAKHGRVGLITMESWMFLSSYEKLRKYILENYHISSLGHFGWHIIGIAFGTAMTIFENSKSNGRKGEYSYLTIDDVDRTINVPYIYPKKDNGRYANISQSNFEKIPGSPIGYWTSKRMIELFNSTTIKDFCYAGIGMRTGDNDRFLRLWHEIALNKFTIFRGIKWNPYNKGGEFRRWYGNNDYVVNWENNGYEIKENTKLVYPQLGDNLSWKITNESYYFIPGITWTGVSPKKFNCRIYGAGFIFDSGANGLFPNEGVDIYLVLAFLNSKIANDALYILNPTINYGAGTIRNIPFIQVKNNEINCLSQRCYEISKQDWDAHETSWDFKINELLALNNESAYTEVINDRINFDGIMPSPSTLNLGSLEWLMDVYKTKWETRFLQLHTNEEELNRRFIEIYGLQDELTPDVPYSEITILQQGEITVDDNNPENPIHWNEDVIMSHLVSYAVGCMMGRYSIDKPGLILANQGDGIREYEKLVPNSRFDIDDDGIVPLMSNNPNLNDNATLRFKRWLSIVFGEDKITENLNFVEKCLGKSIEDYFSKDFWKNHIKMYQNRPIYWLFASKKKAFQCIVYMHRMNAYTVERIRTKYLLPHVEWLVNRQKELQGNAANLTPRERRELDNVTKQIVECREYHDRLHTVADKQIDFDLDDGFQVNYTKFGDVVAKI